MPKQQKIIHERFQKNYREGSTEVQVDFVLEDGVVKISNIHIHGNFDNGLPNSPTLKQQNNKTFLVSHYTNMEGKNVTSPIVGNNYADDIVEQILKLKNKNLNSASSG